MRPNVQQIHDWGDRARKAARDLDKLERRLIAALDRDKAGTTVADGYPSTTMSGGGGSELTSVESAASRRIAGTKDEVRNALERACGYLEQFATSGGAFINSLEKAEKLMNPDKETVVTICDSCGMSPNPRPPEHYGTVNGRLTESKNLCGACYDFVARFEPRTESRLPSEEEILRHHLTGRWRARRTA